MADAEPGRAGGTFRVAAHDRQHSTGFGSRAQHAVAPDGRFLLNVSTEEADISPITIVLNWTAGLKK